MGAERRRKWWLWFRVAFLALLVGSTTYVVVTLHNQKALKVEAPAFVNLKVTETAPGLRGDTVSGASKPATLESGAVIQVPLFINQGDVLKVDTRTGTYVTRA